MKILMISILAALSVNANEIVYGSKSGNIESGAEDAVTIVDLAAGETIEIMSVIGGSFSDRFPDNFTSGRFLINAKYGELPSMSWQQWETYGDQGPSQRSQNEYLPVISHMLVGPCTIQLRAETVDRSNSYQVSYKITKPAASGTTTSAPILLPPTQDAAQSWLVNLQVSSDLKTWEDVQPGQFLGSDSARFFRIQTSEQ
ncbi:hypothetical protein N9Z19_02065 [Akkermansiaceae bacterium]|nr:hypothetical protein [Akkermansiaceae bacterium]